MIVIGQWCIFFVLLLLYSGIWNESLTIKLKCKMSSLISLCTNCAEILAEILAEECERHTDNPLNILRPHL